MNLDNLKPAWRQLRFVNSMQRMDQQEFLLILEKAEGAAVRRTSSFVMYSIMFIVLTCCQGG